MVKGKYMTTNEKLSSLETEAKANRETIQRLVNELSKIEKDSVNNRVLIDTLKGVCGVLIFLTMKNLT
jgi:wobble nucleotide-excising tRNase